MAYSPFNMNDRRYYMFSAAAGLADVFMLDGERLHEGGKFDETQLAWLADGLAKSRAPWKVVGLSRALASAVRGADPDEQLGRRLLPLFDQYKVSFVAWAGGTWYERLALPGHTPVFLNAGWSGRNRPAEFTADPRLKLGYSDRPGFVVLEFWTDRAELRAVSDTGDLVDRIAVSPAGVVTPRPRTEDKPTTAATTKAPVAGGLSPAPAAPAAAAPKAR
jgi:hypothetical protein